MEVNPGAAEPGELVFFGVGAEQFGHGLVEALAEELRPAVPSGIEDDGPIVGRPEGRRVVAQVEGQGTGVGQNGAARLKVPHENVGLKAAVEQGEMLSVRCGGNRRNVEIGPVAELSRRSVGDTRGGVHREFPEVGKVPGSFEQRVEESSLRKEAEGGDVVVGKNYRPGAAGPIAGFEGNGFTIFIPVNAHEPDS